MANTGAEGTKRNTEKAAIYSSILVVMNLFDIHLNYICVVCVFIRGIITPREILVENFGKIPVLLVQSTG